MAPEIVTVTIRKRRSMTRACAFSREGAFGSHVERDQQLCEIETSKAVMDIEARKPARWCTRRRRDEVPVGSMICQILPEGMSPEDAALNMTQSSDVGQPLEEEAAVVEIKRKDGDGALPATLPFDGAAEKPADTTVEPEMTESITSSALDAAGRQTGF